MKILTIFAHPDDETLMTGGTLALLQRAGAQIHYVCATHGEGGELGEPPVSSRDEIGEYRTQELIKAIEALGGGSLSFLNHIDPLIGENQELYPYTDDFDHLVHQIIQIIQTNQPEAVITHGSSGEYGHPGHILTHKGVKKAVEILGKNAPILYTFGAVYAGHPYPRHANINDPAHIIVDITSAMKQKVNAVYCHRSQNALIRRRRSEQAGYRLTIPEVLLNVESLHRAYPPVDGKLEDKVVEMLKPWEKK